MTAKVISCRRKQETQAGDARRRRKAKGRRDERALDGTEKWDTAGPFHFNHPTPLHSGCLSFWLRSGFLFVPVSVFFVGYPPCKYLLQHLWLLSFLFLFFFLLALYVLVFVSLAIVACFASCLFLDFSVSWTCSIPGFLELVLNCSGRKARWFWASGAEVCLPLGPGHTLFFFLVF